MNIFTKLLKFKDFRKLRTILRLKIKSKGTYWKVKLDLYLNNHS